MTKNQSVTKSIEVPLKISEIYIKKSNVCEQLQILKSTAAGPDGYYYRGNYCTQRVSELPQPLSLSSITLKKAE